MKRLILALVAIGCILFPSCGDQKMNTVGRVIKGGVPLVVPEDDFVRILFVPYTEGEKPKTCYIAEFDNAKGTFKAIGPDLHGIPPGKYKVTVAHEKGEERRVQRGV